MKEYAYASLLMAFVFITIAIYESSYLWLIGVIFPLYFSWNVLSTEFIGRSCKASTNGRILSIGANGTFINRLPLYQAEIAYLDRIKTFDNLPNDFIHQAKKGDLISIKYNPSKPHIAIINFSNKNN